MPLSLGPPPTAAESSRTERDATVDAASVLAQREQFMARRARRSGTGPSDHGILRECSSYERVKGEKTGQHGAGVGAQRIVTFADDAAAVQPKNAVEAIPQTLTTSKCETSKRGVSSFMWFGVVVVVVILCVGASMAYGGNVRTCLRGRWPSARLA